MQTDRGRCEMQNARGLGEGAEVGNDNEGAQAVETDLSHRNGIGQKS